MKANVVGIGQRRSGTAKKTGNPYDGTTIYVLTVANDVKGQKAEEVYFNHLSEINFPDDVGIGDVIDVQYNRQGFIDGVSIVSKGKS
jgi:hypothetical protein